MISAFSTNSSPTIVATAAHTACRRWPVRASWTIAVTAHASAAMSGSTLSADAHQVAAGRPSGMTSPAMSGTSITGRPRSRTHSMRA